MSEIARDPLLQLFHEDAHAYVGQLVEKLATLAVDPNHTVDWAAMERAAQGIKASALIVDQPACVSLAEGLADVFSRVRAGNFRLKSKQVSDLMTAVTCLRDTADALVAEDGTPPDVAPALVLLERIVGEKRTAPPPPEVAPPAMPPPVPPPVAKSPPPPVPVPPPHIPVSIDPNVAPLLELFREEVSNLCITLGEGLVELEDAPNDPRKIEPLMRAAHSLKGAARIVGCEPAVDLAHVLEEMFVSTQRGKYKIEPVDVDILLKSVDLLAELGNGDIPGWIAARTVASQEQTAAIEARLQGKTPAPARAVEPPAATPIVVNHPVETPKATNNHTVAPVEQPAAPTKNDDGVKDQVVRISAQSLTRLLSLAGESLVEARWLQPFATSLLKMRKHLDHLADVLDEVCRGMEHIPIGNRARDSAFDSRERLLTSRGLLAERIEEFESHARRSDDLNSRLYREVIASRMRPFSDVTLGWSRMARDVARMLGKKVRVIIEGEDTDVDRDILEKLDAPLGHILRNAIDHGMEMPEERVAVGKPESGSIRVQARHHAGTLNISISDNGRGIDLERLRKKVVEKKLTSQDMASRLSESELLDFLFLPGFSTKESINEISGRGVGLDVVQAMVQNVGGTVRILTKLGEGTTFELQLPITLSVVRAVLVKISGDPFALPLNRTDRLFRLPPTNLRTLEGKPHFEADGRHIGLVPGYQIFDLPSSETNPEEISIVLIGDRTHQYGILVDGFLGEQDLVVRPLDSRLGKVPNVSAAAILEDGSPVLIVDVDDVMRSISMLIHEGKLRHQRQGGVKKAKRTKRILVVDDSAIVREAERQLLLGKGYEVDLAIDGVDGWNAVRGGQYDLVVSDIDMPRMTGLEFVSAIRSDPRVQSIPVVIVSYKDREEDRIRGLEVGANYYLTKSSFHDGRFLDAIEELIGGPLD